MATIDEDKLKKLLDQIVTDMGYLIVDGFYKDQVMFALREKIKRADLTTKDTSETEGS